ncbi:hypothetical protein D3C72_2385880 [compost metagenome]
MLPRTPEPGNPQLERFNQIRQQLLAETPEPAPGYRPPPADPYAARPATEPRREGSLRDSLLKRPLGSIIRKP